MGDSHSPLLASRSDVPFPFTLFAVSDTSNLNFLGCLDTNDTHSGCTTELIGYITTQHVGLT